jgi:adenylate cyclase
MNASPPRKQRLSLFVTVLSLFLMVALLVGTAITVTNYFETRQTALKVADDAFQSTISPINEQRFAFFTPAYLLTTILRNAPSFQTSDGSKDEIRQLILSSLKSNPQISAAYVGYENGNFFHVLSITEAEKTFVEELGGPPLTRFAIQEIRTDHSGGARVQTWLFFDGDNRQIGALTRQSPPYDPRGRGWYRDAMEHPKTVIRTLPYLFSATSQVGMTLAQALESGGVVGVDIALDRLMLYVRSIRANDAHRFVAFDDKNRLLAHFDPRQMFKRSGSGETPSIELATTADVSDPVVREGLQMFSRTGAYRLADFTVAGTTYLATVDRQVARDGGAFFQFYAAPLSDFQGTLADAAGRSIPVALLIFLLSLPAIIYLARSISKPLVRLSKEAELIRSFQLDDPIKMHSRVHEVNTLIRSMSGMKGTIREVSKFVPKALVKDILESEGQVAVGGETRRISILFTDVKDFTPIAEGMSPDGLMAGMSEYFEDLASLIIEANGTVDKFIGDAIFAFWNAPLPVTRHEHAACMTALRCRTASRQLNARWIESGQAAWHTRFGIHVGQAVLGNVGSSDRIDYTAIGDNVNIAARLEGLNKYYGSSILASGQIATVCSDEFLFRHIDRSQPKGVGHPLDIFELLGAIDGPDGFRVTPAMTKLVQDWDGVYEVYASQDWLHALDALETFADQHPEDVLAGIYLDRVVGFLLEPPPEAWDGIIRFSKK